MESQMKIFSGSSNPNLAKKIAEYLKMPLGEIELKRFSDGEISVKLKENVRGVNVFFIQSTCCPVNDNIIELLLMIDAAQRASAKSVTAVIPYFGYARQDRKVEPRVPISAKVIANVIQKTGVNRVLTMDLHADQIQGFFDIPVDNLFGSLLCVEFLKSKNIDNLVVVSPDSGGVDRARYYAKKVGAGLAIIDKRREMANVSEVMHVIGDVAGKNCILIDDIIDTGGSISGAAKALKVNGALKVFCYAAHGVLSGSAYERLSKASFEEIIFTDTIPVNPAKKLPNMIILSVADLFGEAINRIHNGESISSLFL
ncbi:MAG: ribose-phosphate pyrophosphokinase [Spirochaetes bacterium]|jgi:ribose-phosphate pyrophosphokinase|nr:ribose-phosphate pyrophosphokinase [Spirochaetota bacterium]